jgi:hypothetical protein
VRGRTIEQPIAGKNDRVPKKTNKIIQFTEHSIGTPKTAIFLPVFFDAPMTEKVGAPLPTIKMAADE